MKRRPKLRFFLDEGVALSVGRFLEKNGHKVIYFSEAAIKGSPDPVVCKIADIHHAILVAHDGDMKSIARTAGVSNRTYRNLSLLKLSCIEPRAVERLEKALRLIEFEWLNSDSKDRRIYIEVGTSYIKTNR